MNQKLFVSVSTTAVVLLGITQCVQKKDKPIKVFLFLCDDM